MAEFAYNNTINANPSHMLLKLNCSYHLCVSLKNETNPYLKSCLAEKLIKELRNLIFIYQQNLFHIQKLQK